MTLEEKLAQSVIKEDLFVALGMVFVINHN